MKLKGFVCGIIAFAVFFCIGGTCCGCCVIFDIMAIGITAFLVVLQVIFLSGFTITVLYYAGEAKV